MYKETILPNARRDEREREKDIINVRYMRYINFDHYLEATRRRFAEKKSD